MGDDAPGARPAAVALYSGGLDSILTVEVLRRAGVEVTALRHHSVFFPLPEGGRVPPCPVITREISAEMLELVRNPQHGLGSNANPCLDCKQMMYGRAWDEARRIGAGFIATGEVLGQRPMSQHREAFARLEKEAGVEGLVVRPLCGRLLPPTIPEQRGWIRREDLLDIRGRSRRRQMALAREWGIEDYPTPAGGCKLTDPNFADRVLKLRDLDLLTEPNVRAARHGRFFVPEGGALLLVGRNDEDNRALLADAPDDALILQLRDRPGPVACLVGEAGQAAEDEARRLVIRYSRFRDLPPGEVEALAVAEARRQWELEPAG